MKKETEKNSPNLNYIIIIVLFSALVINSFTSSFNLFGANEIAGKIVSEVEENNRPANLQITIIDDENCLDCFDINPIIEKIKGDNVNIEKEVVLERTDSVAQELIKKYAIEKLPTFVISGEINKNDTLVEVWGKIGEIKEETFVFRSVLSPYIQADSGEVRGRVELTIIDDENCLDCFDADKYKLLPQQMQMAVKKETVVDYKSLEGRNIIKKYGIESIPTIIITGDMEVYPINNLKRFGDIVDNSFILTQVQPPYINTRNGKLMGKIDLTFISDKSCTDCYDVTVYDGIIDKFGLFVQSKKTIDIQSASGKYLVKRYKIETIPTVIMTGDVEVYNSPGSVWSGIGSMETNGAYVIRESGVKQLGAYKNLISGEVIGAENN